MVASKKNILVINHTRYQNPGIFRQFAAAAGLALHEVDVDAGEKIPDVSGFDALWSMGGTMNVWDEDTLPWLIQEKETIRSAVNTHNMPFLGICLGHQLLAEAMGGSVSKTENYELGLFEIEPTPTGIGHPILSNVSLETKWVNAHFAEVVTLPPSAVILAKSNKCQNHIMQIGDNAFSCQFHPEVAETTFDGWMRIPGIHKEFVNTFGTPVLERFRSDVNQTLKANNVASLQLIENWYAITMA